MTGASKVVGGEESVYRSYSRPVEDVSFDRGHIRVRPNEHRSLKTKRSRRDVPLWPQLREILEPFIFLADSPKSGLLFPSPRRKGKMLKNCRKQHDAVGDRAGFEDGRIRWHVLRHTYTAARIQTYDVVKRPGADGEAVEQPIPVALYSVARELGHSSTRLIEERYGHLAQNPDRKPTVEYRAEEHKEALGERLKALQAA